MKFCPFCGGEQKEITISKEIIEMNEETVTPEEIIIEEPIAHTQENVNEAPHTEQVQQTPLVSINQDAVNQLTNNSKNYLTYLNKNIAKPNLGGSNKNGYFGLISFGLVSLFSSLAISHSMGKAVNVGTQNITNLSFPMFLQLLLLLLATQFVNVLTVYVLKTKLFPGEGTILDSFDNVYAPISLTVYTSLLALVLSFISTIGFSLLFSIVLMITFILGNISYIANLWVTETLNSNKNKFYWTVGTIFVAFIVQFLVTLMMADIIGTGMLDVFSNITHSFTPNFPF